MKTFFKLKKSEIINYVSEYPLDRCSELTHWFIPSILQWGVCSTSKRTHKLLSEMIDWITINTEHISIRTMCVLLSSRKRPESPSILLSCLLPSTGPNKFAIKPLGTTTDGILSHEPSCGFIVHDSLSFSCSTRRSYVPSTNPQQFSRGAPLSWIALANT